MFGSVPFWRVATSLLSVTDQGNGPAAGTTSGVAQSSLDSVTVTIVSAPPTAPCESFAVSETGHVPARSKACVVVVTPLFVDQSSANVHCNSNGSPSTSLALPPNATTDPRATEMTPTGAAIETAGGWLTTPVTANSQ